MSTWHRCGHPATTYREVTHVWIALSRVRLTTNFLFTVKLIVLEMRRCWKRTKHIFHSGNPTCQVGVYILWNSFEVSFSVKAEARAIWPLLKEVVEVNLI